MSIPLAKDNSKDSINTSIIAIKRQIERINALLGLSNSEEIDTSVFATKDELQQAVTDLQPVDEVTANNMQSVTSNAVAKKLSYSSTEFKTGGKWIDGKPIYRKVYDVTTPSSNNVIVNVADTPSNFQKIISLQGLIYGDYNNAYIYYPINHFITTEDYSSCWIRATNQKIAMKVYGTSKLNKPAKIIIEYTKTTD